MQNQVLCKGKSCKATAVANMIHTGDWNKKFHLKNLIIQMGGSDAVRGE